MMTRNSTARWLDVLRALSDLGDRRDCDAEKRRHPTYLVSLAKEAHS